MRCGGSAPGGGGALTAITIANTRQGPPIPPSLTHFSHDRRILAGIAEHDRRIGAGHCSGAGATGEERVPAAESAEFFGRLRHGSRNDFGMLPASRKDGTIAGLKPAHLCRKRSVLCSRKATRTGEGLGQRRACHRGFDAAVGRSAGIAGTQRVSAANCFARRFPARKQLTVRGSSFFVGNLNTGEVLRGDYRTGTVEALAASPGPGAQAVGLKVDVRTNYLFVAASTFGARVYNASTGALKKPILSRRRGATRSSSMTSLSPETPHTSRTRAARRCTNCRWVLVASCRAHRPSSRFR